MSLTTEVTAGVLGVPGLPFGMLLPRSLDFVALYDLIKIRWLDPFDRYFLLVGMQVKVEKFPQKYYRLIFSIPFFFSCCGIGVSRRD